ILTAQAPAAVVAKGPTPAAQVNAVHPSSIQRDSLPIYFEHQVAEPVTAISWGPRLYPSALKAQKIGGEVVLKFVVDSTGHVEPGSERVVGKSRPEFITAAMSMLASARFTPALRRNMHVRQFVEQAFVFAPKR